MNHSTSCLRPDQDLFLRLGEDTQLSISKTNACHLCYAVAAIRSVAYASQRYWQLITINKTSSNSTKKIDRSIRLKPRAPFAGKLWKSKS